MSEWPVEVLDRLVQEIVDRRGVTPLKLGSGFSPRGHRVISAKLVKDGKVDLSADQPRYVDEVTYRRWMRSPLQPDDVILTSEAPLGEAAYIKTRVDWCLGQRLFAIRTRKALLHGRFLYYALRSKVVQHDLLSRATGTTAQGIRQTELRRIQIPLPPLPEQSAIAQFLGALDDKIELNRKMIDTLAASARAIFKAWFVDFGPVRAKAAGTRPMGVDEETAARFPGSFEDSELGEIPSGWKVAEIGDVCDVIDCLHSRKPDRSESGKTLLQLSNIRDDGLIDMADVFYIDETDYKLWTSRMEASPGDCVITNVGRVGAVAQIPAGLRAALGRNMTGIRCRSDFPFPTFIIECLLSKSMREEMLLRTDSGTILDALNVRNIPKLRFVRGTSNLLNRFELLARPIRRRMEASLSESRALVAVRDALLPKLVSGRVRVPLDQTAGATA